MTGLNGGAITLASNQTLAGNGTVIGGVVAANGSHVAPGIGTLTVGSLNMTSGSIYNYQFNSTPANGLINVSTAGGLTINGGGFNLYNQGSTTPFATPGTYTLLQYSGSDWWRRRFCPVSANRCVWEGLRIQPPRPAR